MFPVVVGVGAVVGWWHLGLMVEARRDFFHGIDLFPMAWALIAGMLSTLPAAFTSTLSKRLGAYWFGVVGLTSLVAAPIQAIRDREPTLGFWIVLELTLPALVLCGLLIWCARSEGTIIVAGSNRGRVAVGGLFVVLSVFWWLFVHALNTVVPIRVPFWEVWFPLAMTLAWCGALVAVMLVTGRWTASATAGIGLLLVSSAYPLGQLLYEQRVYVMVGVVQSALGVALLAASSVQALRDRRDS
jgi:hypothetical protein